MDLWDYMFVFYVSAIMLLTYSEYSNDYERFEDNYGHYLKQYPDLMFRTHMMVAFAFSVHMIEFLQIYFVTVFLLFAIINAQLAFQEFIRFVIVGIVNFVILAIFFINILYNFIMFISN